MQPLNFPKYGFRFKSSENKVWIFDVVRKKFVVLQPEEWVRQHTLRHLAEGKGYPLSLINIEKQLMIGRLRKRYDIVVYNPDGSIHVLVECKSPETVVTQDTFDQIARYNRELRASYLMVTNGLRHFYCRMDYEQEKYTFLRDIPDFSR